MSNRSAYLVDPALREPLAQVPSFQLSDAILSDVRAMLDERFSTTLPDDDDVKLVTLHIPRQDGSLIRVLAYHPQKASGPLPAIFYMHGGGFVLLSPEVGDIENRALCAELGCVIYGIDYRLSPEARYPDALEDGYTVMQWAYRNAADQGLDPARFVVKGESAGGALAAGLALMARDRGEIKLKAMILTFPALDDRTGTSTDPHPFCGEYVWNAEGNAYAWASYLGKAPGGADTPGYAAPGRATDLSGLPAAFIAVGALDLYLEEDLDFTARLARAGVPVELHVYPGAVHGFTIAPGSYIDRASSRDLRDALSRALRPE